MIDIGAHLGAVSREVVEDGGNVRVTMRRHYTADPSDVWNAVTDPDRIRRWFVPVSGDLREGGNFVLENHASGDILTCQPPERLVVTFGGETSIVELRLTADGDRTELVLEHAVPVELAGSTAGALFVGPGWDGALLAIGLYLDGETIDDPVALGNTPEGQEFSLASIEAWTTVLQGPGGPGPEAIEGGRLAALAQFTPDLVQG